MSTPGMVLEYVNALKWPILVTGLALYFRKTIELLAGRLRSLKAEAGPAKLELEAADTIDYIESTAEIPPVAQVPPPESHGPLQQPMEASPGTRAGIDTGADESGLVPGLGTAVSLGTDGRKIAYRRLKDLRLFAEGPAGDPMDTMMWIVRDPSHAVIETAKELSRTVKSLRPPNVAWVLWPDRPEPLYRGFRRLRLLYGGARSHPENVTPAVVYDFDRAARLWASQYADFIDAALQAAQRQLENSHQGLS